MALLYLAAAVLVAGRILSRVVSISPIIRTGISYLGPARVVDSHIAVVEEVFVGSRCYTVEVEVLHSRHREAAVKEYRKVFGD